MEPLSVGNIQKIIKKTLKVVNVGIGREEETEVENDRHASENSSSSDEEEEDFEDEVADTDPQRFVAVIL